MKRRNLVVLAVILVGVAGFVAFRPDKLFVDDRVDEDLASAFVTSTTEPDSTEPISTEPTTSLPAAGAATDTTEAASGSTSSSTATQPEPGPVQVSTGDFVGVDHSATGTAAIFEQNGTFVLRFEDPKREADTLVRFKEMSIVTEPVAEEVFSQTPPPGMSVETISCD